VGGKKEAVMMRATALLAAVLAMGVAGGPAGAQRAGPAFRNAPSGHRPASPGGRVQSLSGHGFRNAFGRFGFHRRMGRAFFGQGAFGYGGLIGYGDLGGYGADALDDPEDLARESGFFEGEGDVRIRGGEARYAYDRSYPYDWYREPEARPAARRIAMREDSPRSVHCESEHMVRVCRGD
jgi:hypothetical protein